MKRPKFVQLLKEYDLYEEFIENYGDDYEADDDYEDGWIFEHNKISYRLTKLFDDYSEGYNWDFIRDSFDQQLVDLLFAQDYYIEFNGGDEDDALFVMLKNN